MDKTWPISKRVFETGEYDPEGRSYEYSWFGWLSLGSGRKIGDTFYTNVAITNDFFYAYIEKIESTGKTYGQGTIQLDIDDKSDFLKLYKRLKEDESIPCDNTRSLLEKIMRKYDKNEYNWFR